MQIDKNKVKWDSKPEIIPSLVKWDDTPTPATTINVPDEMFAAHSVGFVPKLPVTNRPPPIVVHELPPGVASSPPPTIDGERPRLNFAKMVQPFKDIGTVGKEALFGAEGLPEGLGYLQKPVEYISEKLAESLKPPEAEGFDRPPAESIEAQKKFMARYPNFAAFQHALTSLVLPGVSEVVSDPEKRSEFARMSPEEQRLEILGLTAGYAAFGAAGKAVQAAKPLLVNRFPWLGKPAFDFISKSNWFRKLTNRKRGLVVQNINEIVVGMEKSGVSEAQILRTLRKEAPAMAQKRFAKMQGIKDVSQEPGLKLVRPKLVKPKPETPKTIKAKPKAKEPSKKAWTKPVFGWDAVKLSDNYGNAELTKLQEAVQNDPASLNPNKNSIHIYTQDARKKLEKIAWAITYNLKEAKAKKPAVSPAAKMPLNMIGGGKLSSEKLKKRYQYVPDEFFDNIESASFSKNMRGMQRGGNIQAGNDTTMLHEIGHMREDLLAATDTLDKQWVELHKKELNKGPYGDRPGNYGGNKRWAFEDLLEMFGIVHKRLSGIELTNAETSALLRNKESVKYILDNISKPVPAEVLKDYPELAKKPAVSPAAVKTPTPEKVAAPKAKPTIQAMEKPLGEMYRTPSPIPKDKVVWQDVIPRRSETIKEIERIFDIPIRIGRSQQLAKKALGIYKVKPEVVRLKMANDIEVAAHEAGHHIQKVLGFPKRLPAEVQAMAYPGAKDTSSEGFAEFVRMYITEPTAAKQKAPNYFKEFEDSLAKYPDIKGVFEKILNNWNKWQKLPSQQKVMSYIKSGADIAADKTITFDRIYTTVIDEFRPIQVLVKKAEKAMGAAIPTEKDPFKIAWLTRGWARKAEQFLKFGSYIETPGEKEIIKFTGPSLKTILKPIESKNRLRELDAYLVARRALSDDRIVKGFKNQLTRSDFRQTVNEGKAEFGETARKLYAYQDNILQHLVDSSRISPQHADTIRKNNLFYAPLYRAMDTEIGAMGKKGFSKVTDPIKRLRGSSRDIISPTENMVYNTFSMLNVAEKNRVGRAIAELSEIEGLGKLIEKVPRKMKPVSIKASEIERLGYAPVFPEDAKMIETIFRPSPALEKNEVVFYKNGKPQHYIIGDKDLYNSITALDRDAQHILVKILSYPAKWLRTGATLSPEFILRNPLRDQMTAFVFSNYGYKPFWDAGRGMFHILKKDKIYQLYNTSGAAHATLVSLDRDYISKGLNELLKDKNIRDLYKKPLRSFQILSELTEEATRVSEFRRAIKKEGLTKAGLMKSGIAARDVTLDFSRIGAKTKAYNAITAFANAQIQGSDKLFRAFKKNPNRTTLKAIAGITVPSLLLWSVNKDDPYYQELPNWRKVLFWNFVFHNKDGSLKRIISIPKPFELGILFGTAPAMALNWAYKKDKTGMEEAAKTMVDAFLPSAIPTAATPIIENYANKSLFFDRPIVPRGREELSPSLQYGPRTSETTKLIGKVIKQSPAKIENLIRGWTGNLGYMTIQASDKMLKFFNITNVPTRPSMTLSDIPGIRGFTTRFPSGSAKSIEDFYRLYTKEKTAWNDRRGQQNNIGRLVDKALVKKKIIVKPDQLQKYEDTAQKLSRLRQVIGIVYDSNMSPGGKRKSLDRLYFLMINTARSSLGKDLIKTEPQPLQREGRLIGGTR